MRSRMRGLGWSLAAMGAGAVLVAAQSRLVDFGLHVDRIKPDIVESFVGGYLPAYPNTKAYHAASVATRVAFVKEGLAWVKAYTQTAAFKADYEKHRADAKPEAAEAKGSPDDQYNKMLADQRKQLEEMKKNVSAMSPDMQKAMQPVIQQLEEGIKKTASDPQTAAMLKQSFAQGAANDQENARKDMADYEKRYPADANVLIARRLREFLEESSDVNYGAALVPSGGGRMRFADEQLEAKSDKWKLYYRAGREPVEAARAFAAEWLREIEAK